MSDWPWMKGVHAPIASSPEPPLDKHDHRPSVLELINKHKAKIDEVRSKLAKSLPLLYDANKHDDLWILRFILSHKKVKPAVAAATTTLEFRAEHKLDEQDMREDVESIKNDTVRKMERCSAEGTLQFSLVGRKRGVIVFIDIGGFDQHKMVETISKEEWFNMFLPNAEWAFQWLDYVTRTTGRLTKSIRLVDVSGLRPSGFSPECARRDGDAMAKMQDCYPQLLETILVCNTPLWVQVPWRIIRPLLPKRVVTKIDFINPEGNEKERKRVLKHIPEENLPKRFGGKSTLWPVPMLPAS